jgi:hypothetical protein
VAEWAFDHFLLPLDKHRGHHDGHANGHSDKDHAAE